MNHHLRRYLYCYILFLITYIYTLRNHFALHIAYFVNYHLQFPLNRYPSLFFPLLYIPCFLLLNLYIILDLNPAAHSSPRPHIEALLIFYLRNYLIISLFLVITSLNISFHIQYSHYKTKDLYLIHNSLGVSHKI